MYIYNSCVLKSEIKSLVVYISQKPRLMFESQLWYKNTALQGCIKFCFLKCRRTELVTSLTASELLHLSCLRNLPWKNTTCICSSCIKYSFSIFKFCLCSLHEIFQPHKHAPLISVVSQTLFTQKNIWISS